MYVGNLTNTIANPAIILRFSIANLGSVVWTPYAPPVTWSPTVLPTTMSPSTMTITTTTTDDGSGGSNHSQGQETLIAFIVIISIVGFGI